MATQPPDPRSGGGGKMRTTRQRSRFNPYDRPPPPQPPKNPNWLSGVIVPASRKIANSAAKILSSVFVSDSSSSSSGSSASGNDSADEDDTNSDIDRDIAINESNLETETSAERMRYMSNELGVGVEKNKRKQVIEQLLLQETFSREECDRLVKIIHSRVVEPSTIGKGENAVSADTPGKPVDSVTPDLCIEAVKEAQKWLKERKAGQSPVSDYGRGSFGLNSPMLQHIDNNVGSPVNMAKSYMRARPPWSSPSAEHIELRTPLTMTTQLIREVSYSVGDNSLSPSKKKSSLAGGAWNIQDEIRRVRSKATEDMLHPLSSSKVDLSSFSLSRRGSQEYVATNKVVAGTGDKVSDLSCSVEPKPVDGLVELVAGASINFGLSGLETREGAIKETSLFNQATNFVLEQNQEIEAIQIEGEDASRKSDHPASNDRASDPCPDTNLSCENGSTEKEEREFAEAHNANGLPSSQASLSAGNIMEENHKHSFEETVASLSHGKSSNGLPVEGRCELLSEVSVDVPVQYEIADVASLSQNSYEELTQVQNQPEEKQDFTENTDDTTMKQQGKNPRRISRRVGRRGKVMG